MTQRLALILSSVVALCGVIVKPHTVGTALFFWVTVLLMFKTSDRIDEEASIIEKSLLVALLVAVIKNALT